MDNVIEIHPRIVRPRQAPLGSYIRVGKDDNYCLQTFLEVSGAHFHGLVLDATRVKQNDELHKAALGKQIDVVLDPKTQEAATEGAFNPRIAALPWIEGKQNVPADFESNLGRRRARALAEFVKENGFTKIMSPSHYIQSCDDDWFEADVNMVSRLRDALDGLGLSSIPIAYSLAIPYSVLHDPSEVDAIFDRLNSVPVEEIWLRVDRFGSDASPRKIRNYIEAGRSLHRIEKPIVADHVGGLAGLALLAFGGVGGLAHGITSKERFSGGHWFKPPADGQGFGQHHRVYFPELDITVKPRDAQRLMDEVIPLRAKICCHDSECCPRGISDMVSQPGRHFLNQRDKQLRRLSDVPGQLRPSVFLEEFVRKASDTAMYVSNLRISDDSFRKKMQKVRLRLDSLRETLRVFADKKPANTFSSIPMTRVVREAEYGSRSEDRRPSP